MPAHLKSWFDIVITDPRFSPAVKSLDGRPVTLLVVRAVRTRHVVWLVLAILAHAAVDSGALVLMRVTHSNIAAVEGTLTVAAVAALAYVRAERRA